MRSFDLFAINVKSKMAPNFFFAYHCSAAATNGRELFCDSYNAGAQFYYNNKDNFLFNNY